MPQGSINITIRGLKARGDLPITLTEPDNIFTGNKPMFWRKLGQFSETVSNRVFYDESQTATVPGQPEEVALTFPGATFTADVLGVRLAVTINGDYGRGGAVMADCRLDYEVVQPQAMTLSNIGCLRDNEAIFREDSGMWGQWVGAFLSRQPIIVRVSGLESFRDWTESRQFDATFTLQAWGET